MEDEVSTLRTDPGSVGSQVSDLCDDYSELVEKVDKLKPSATGGSGVTAPVHRDRLIKKGGSRSIGECGQH